MARSRNLKPGFFKNEELAECDPLARILFAGLWTIADREGRLEDRPKRIKAEILPYDNVDPSALLDQLQQFGFIVRYRVAGQGYISIPTFTKNQQPHVNEAPSMIPPPDNSPLYKEEYHTSTVQVPEQYGANSPLTESLIPHPESLNLGANAPIARDEFSTFAQEIWELYPDREGSKVGRAKLEANLKDISPAQWPNVRKAVINYKNSGRLPVDPFRFIKSRDYPNGMWREFVNKPAINGASHQGKGPSPYTPPLDASKYQEGGQYGHLFNTPKKETA